MQNIDQLVHTAHFGESKERAQAQLEIWNLAQERDIIPCSIYDFYQAKAKAKIPLNFTVPAVNLRGLSYHCAQMAFKAAQKNRVGAFIFEIARSEMSYTAQNPGQYMASILGAAIKTNWQNPVFLQGDHFQSKPQNKQIDTDDLEKIKNLIKQSILAGFFNLDLDGSLLINNSNQTANANYTASLTAYIRSIQPANINISLGAEINPIGSTRNSTPEDLDSFMIPYQKFLEGEIGISKVAIQTGTAHGGTVDPSGKIKKAELDLKTIKQMGQYVREKYGLGGVVQHGASTLNSEMFPLLAQTETLEVHLSTGFQNLIFDHPQFPQELTNKIKAYILEKLQSEHQEGQSEPQFLYKLRKKAWKQFKSDIWEINPDNLEKIMSDVEKRFDFYFQALNVINTQDLLNKYIEPIKINRKLEDFISINGESTPDPEDLDD